MSTEHTYLVRRHADGTMHTLQATSVSALKTLIQGMTALTYKKKEDFDEEFSIKERLKDESWTKYRCRGQGTLTKKAEVAAQTAVDFVEERERGQRKGQTPVTFGASENPDEDKDEDEDEDEDDEDEDEDDDEDEEDEDEEDDEDDDED